MMRCKYWFLLIFIFLNTSTFSQGFLKASGKKIVDAKGKEILLRGMGLGGWMLQEPYMLQLSGVAVNQGDIRQKIVKEIGKEKTSDFYSAWLKNHCTKADIDSMKAWGFNSVRLPMHYNLYTLPLEEEPVSGKQTWLETGFAMTDSLLSWCKANKMYLILDLHAAPGGQGSDNAISDRDSTKPSLWQSEGKRQKTVALWQKLAQRYANEEWIGGYDLINETNWGFQNRADKNGCAETDNAPLRHLLVDITTAIREVDKNHLIFIEGNCWANNYKGVLPAWDSNMALSFHKYWNDNTQGSIQQFIDLREQHNIPLWMGESGENSNVWFRSAIELFERNNIGWAWWPLKKMGINNPFQIKSNPDYQKLIAYWKGAGPQPQPGDTFKGLMKLAEDSRIENTIYHKNVVDAMFRQVKDGTAHSFAEHNINKNPVVFAVHFDMGRIGEAYYTKDSANYWVSRGKRVQWNKGLTYRNDAVDIEVCTDSLSNGFKVTSLEPTEWLQYTIHSSKKGNYNLQIRVAAKEMSSFDVMINNKIIAAGYAVANNNWQTVELKNLALKKGNNTIRIKTKSGELSLNSLHFIKNEIQP